MRILQSTQIRDGELTKDHPTWHSRIGSPGNAKFMCFENVSIMFTMVSRCSIILCLFVSLLLASCSGSDLYGRPSTHTSIDGYVLRVNDNDLRPGDIFTLTVDVAKAEQTTTGLISDLERQTPNGDWHLVSRIASPFPASSDALPRAISLDEELWYPPAGVFVNQEFVMKLPDNMRKGRYRIVKVLSQPEDVPVRLSTVAVEFDVQSGSK